MVPGSTLMYGSSFWKVTVKPLASSSEPMDAAESPLPSEESTPPVMKMNLVFLLREAFMLEPFWRRNRREAASDGPWLERKYTRSTAPLQACPPGKKDKGIVPISLVN